MSVAKSYAKALYESAAEAQAKPEDLDEIERRLDAIAQLMQNSRELQVALQGPAVSAKEKASVARQIAQRLQASQLLTRFLALVAEQERFCFLPEIREAFVTVRLEAEGGVLGKLISADPMESLDVDALSSAFSKKLGKKVAFRATTDASLLAGMRVTVNGVTYDGTLRSQLQRLRDRLVFNTGATH